MSRYDDLRRMREATACTHKSRLFGNRWLPQTTRADRAGSSGNLPPPSAPAEKSTGCRDQAGQASTGDGARDGSPMRCLKKKKRADRRGRPARSGDELTTTASCQGEKATACQDPGRAGASNSAERRRVKAIRQKYNRDPNGGLAVGPRRSGLSFELCG